MENLQVEELVKGDSSQTPFSASSTRGRIGLSFGKNTRKNSVYGKNNTEQMGLGMNMISDPTLMNASEEPVSVGNAKSRGALSHEPGTALLAMGDSTPMG